MEKRFRYLASQLWRVAIVASLLPAAVGFAIQSELALAAADVDAEYRDPNEPGDGMQVVILNDRVLGPGQAFSFLMGPSDRPGRYGPLCASLAEASCSGEKTVSYKAVLQPCSQSNQLDCISGFGSATESNDRTPGSFLGTFPTRGRHDFMGDVSKKLPSGGAATLWSLPSQPHRGGTTYMVQVVVSGYKAVRSDTFSSNSDFVIEITPVEIVGDEGTQCDLDPATGVHEECGEDQGPGFYVTQIVDEEPVTGIASRVSSSDFDCSLLAQKQCARRHPFPSNARLYLTVRLSQSPTGWLHGRVSKPLVAVNSLGDTAVEIDIAANSVKTPVLAVARPWAQLPEPLREAYRATGGYNGAPAGTRNRAQFESGPEIRNAISGPTAYSTTGMAELLAWLPYIGDKSTADISRWMLRSMSDGELAGASSCFANRSQLNGLLMTNATQYSAGPPTFDRAAGSLEYKVAAPHYTSGGSTFLGTYDLVMRSTVARCLYGFTNAPLNVSISVVDNDGSNSVATKVVSERDGWLRIAAYGFGFSAPTIKVQMTQEQPPVAKPSNTTTVKRTTITCRKGKTIRKVTAIKPSCPKGWKPRP
jgi:hypothetical protein